MPVLEACAVGLIAGTSAIALTQGVEWLGALRVSCAQIAPKHVVLPIFGLIGGFLSGLLVERVAPEASGSGIPQVKAALDRVRMPLNLRIALVKLVGGIFAIGSGLFMGREGPTVQLGAALAAQLGRWIPSGAQYRRQLTAAGAGAGLAAAFNAPIAGVIFVLEELLKEVKLSTIGISMLACFMASMVLNRSEGLHPHSALVGGPTASLDYHDVLFYLVLGVVSGVVGAMFNKGILASLNFNRERLPVPVFVRTALAGLMSGLIIAALPSQFENYAGMRNLIIHGNIDFYLVPMAFLTYFLLTLLAYGSGAPGGLFAPSLALGASLGYLVAIAEKLAFHMGSTEVFALVGMGSFFAAVARMPLTATVIVFELTSDYGLIIPLMLTSVLATTVGEILAPGSLYELLMVWIGINLRGPQPESQAVNLRARDIMHRNPRTVSSKESLKVALDLFTTSQQRGLPVVDKGKLVGVLTQTDLVKVQPDANVDRAPIAQFMTKHPVSVSPHDSLEDILFLFTRYKFVWLPVTSQDRLRGIILQSDVIKALLHPEQVDHALSKTAGDEATGDADQSKQSMEETAADEATGDADQSKQSMEETAADQDSLSAADELPRKSDEDNSYSAHTDTPESCDRTQNG